MTGMLHTDAASPQELKSLDSTVQLVVLETVMDW